jgi:hypothetical protein
MTYLILILSLLTGVTINFLVVQIHFLNNKNKRLINDVNTVTDGIIESATYMTSGNVSHKRGTILNSCNHIKLIINKE